MNNKQIQVLEKFNSATDSFIEALQDLARYHDVEPTNAVKEVDGLRIKINRVLGRSAIRGKLIYDGDHGAE